MSNSLPNQIKRPESENDSRLAGAGKGFVDPAWQSVFLENGFGSVEDFFNATGKALSKPGLGKRYRARLELNRDGQTCSVFYKRYAGEKFRALIQRWFEDGARLPIAAREVRVAEALQDIGITTFKPLAWGWRGGWGVSQKSFIVMSGLEGKSLERWLEESPFSQSHVDWIKKKNLIREAADLARRLHQAGWFHRDFYLCHIFVRNRGAAFKLSILDLARVFRPRWRVERWLVKDLAQLNYSTPHEQFSRTMRIRFAKIYFGCVHLTPSQKSLLRKIARRSEFLSERDLRKRKMICL